MHQAEAEVAAAESQLAQQEATLKIAAYDREAYTKLARDGAQNADDKKWVALQQIVGADPLPYGLEANVKTIEALIDYSLQQKLIKDGVEAAVADAQKIAQLTAAVFTAAFDPVKKQIDSVHTPKLN